MNKKIDPVDLAFAQVYGWKISKDKKGKHIILPPARQYPLPDFVEKRIAWVSSEMKNGLTFRGAFEALFDIDDEDKVKKDWDFGAASDYLPVSKKYKDWINDPLTSDFHRIAAAVELIYG